MSSYGRFFHLVRGVARLFLRVNEVPAPDDHLEPCVYVCRHKNMRGPLYTMANLKTPVRPWVLDVFCDRETCYRHYRDYTFSQRFKWRRWQAALVARLASLVIPPLIRSLAGIPVYRGSAKIMATYRRTIAALKANQSVIIYPDIDYTDMRDGNPGLYQGYLLLDRLYRRETGRALPFVPLHVDLPGKRIIKGNPICFAQNASDYEYEKRRVGEAVHRELVGLARR